MAMTLNFGEVPDSFGNLNEHYGLFIEEYAYAHLAFNFREFLKAL